MIACRRLRQETSVARIQILSSDGERAGRLTDRLKSLGFEVQAGSMSETLRQGLFEQPPRAIILDLDRAPATCRDLGLSIRLNPATRSILLVFLGGEADKIEDIQQLLPDAVYTNDANLVDSVTQGLANPSNQPVIPESVFAGYRGRPLPAKLGIKPDMRVSLLDAPPEFGKTLEPLPTGVHVEYGSRSPADITLWFVSSRSELTLRIESTLDLAAGGKLWIIWPKKSSGVVSDLSQTFVRQAGLDAGWVDFKICAVDATWSGLCFTMRK
jgi:hypothetical protein